MAPTDANVPGRRWISESFAVFSSSSVTGRSPRMPRSSFMNSTSAASVLSPTMSPPVRNGSGPLAEAEARADAVAVALLLADVGVQARLEHAAENRVHHLQRVVVRRGRAAGRAGRWRTSTARRRACRRDRSSSPWPPAAAETRMPAARRQRGQPPAPSRSSGESPRL